MTTQDVCARKHRNSPTSVAANARAQKGKEYWQQRVYAYLRFMPGTCEEVSKAIDLPYTSTSARISELKRDGWLVPTGERRPTATGSSAAVLRCVSEQEREQTSFGFKANPTLKTLGVEAR